MSPSTRASTSIPVIKNPMPMLEPGRGGGGGGPNSDNLAAMASSKHPVDTYQRRRAVGAGGSGGGIGFARNVYGSGLAMRLATEQHYAMNERCDHHAVFSSRGGGGSNGVYGDIISGRDIDIDHSDILSLPQHRPDYQDGGIGTSPHTIMERRLGM